MSSIKKPEKLLIERYGSVEAALKLGPSRILGNGIGVLTLSKLYAKSKIELTDEDWKVMESWITGDPAKRNKK